jgi:hypothetical protein
MNPIQTSRAPEAASAFASFIHRSTAGRKAQRVAAALAARVTQVLHHAPADVAAVATGPGSLRSKLQAFAPRNLAETGLLLSILGNVKGLFVAKPSPSDEKAPVSQVPLDIFVDDEVPNVRNESVLKVDMVAATAIVLVLALSRKLEPLQRPLLEAYSSFTGLAVETTTPIKYQKWLLAILGALALRRVAQAWWRRHKSPIGASIATQLIDKTISRGELQSSAQRQVFVETPIVRSEFRPAGHTHPESAANRSAGTATAALVAQSLGLNPYYIQMSKDDERKGRDGARSFHWDKDLAVKSQPFKLDTKKDCGILIDVDYYVDMPHLLATHPGTYLLYTFQPTAAAEHEGEYTFRFKENQHVEYRVSGGAVYDHQVWDYSKDTITVKDPGVLMDTVSCYHIDRKMMDKHHCVILLSLIATFKVPTFVPLDMVLSGGVLSRLEPFRHGHVILDTVHKDGMYRSVALNNGIYAVTLPRHKFDSVYATAMSSKVGLTPALVSSNINQASLSGLPAERLPPGYDKIIACHVRLGVRSVVPVVVSPDEAILPILYSHDDFDAQPTLKAFGSPITEACYGHVRSIFSDDKCIFHRVEKFQDTAEDGGAPPTEKEIPPSIATAMQQFLEFMIPVPHTGSPADYDEVYARQDRPSQQRKLFNAEVVGDFARAMWTSFQKVEPYQKVTEPRNISQAEDKVKLEYSTFIYAFQQEVMADLDWYAFNKTPQEIAARIVVILSGAEHAVLSDANRWDGHIKRIMRVLERCAMLRHFRPEFHEVINELMDKQINLTGRTAEGRKYESAFSRGSGSAETAVFNSLENAFIAFLAWMRTSKNGRYLTPEEAYAALGMYGGDDSIDGGIDPRALRRSAELLGQDFDIDVVPRGDKGVNFLNRQFGPNVWFGDMNSMSNPDRALSKFFVGPYVLHHPGKRVAERASGYLRMDANTPVLGDLCRAAVEIFGETDVSSGILVPYFAKFPKGTNWPNEDSGWMTDTFSDFLPNFDHSIFREHLVFMRHMDNAGAQAAFFQFPKCTPPEKVRGNIKYDVVVGDELLRAGPNGYNACVDEVVEVVPKADPDEDRDDKGPQFVEINPQAVAAVNAVAQLVPVAKTVKDKPVQKPTPTPARDHLHPRDWVAPKQKDGQSFEDFKTVLQEWTTFRAKKWKQVARDEARATQVRKVAPAKAVPAAPLVGIEPNPGPATIPASVVRDLETEIQAEEDFLRGFEFGAKAATVLVAAGPIVRKLAVAGLFTALVKAVHSRFPAYRRQAVLRFITHVTGLIRARAATRQGRVAMALFSIAVVAGLVAIAAKRANAREVKRTIFVGILNRLVPRQVDWRNKPSLSGIVVKPIVDAVQRRLDSLVEEEIAEAFPPAAPLVGVEPNPGPGLSRPDGVEENSTEDVANYHDQPIDPDFVLASIVGETLDSSDPDDVVEWRHVNGMLDYPSPDRAEWYADNFRPVVSSPRDTCDVNTVDVAYFEGLITHAEWLAHDDDGTPPPSPLMPPLDTPDPLLVGIETNPGPRSPASHFNRFVHWLENSTTRDGVRLVLLRAARTFRRLARDMNPRFQSQNPLGDIHGGHYREEIVIGVWLNIARVMLDNEAEQPIQRLLDVATLFRKLVEFMDRPPAPPLVGIEPNPGPRCMCCAFGTTLPKLVDMRCGYCLSMIAKCEACEKHFCPGQCQQFIEAVPMPHGLCFKFCGQWIVRHPNSNQAARDELVLIADDQRSRDRALFRPSLWQQNHFSVAECVCEYEPASTPRDVAAQRLACRSDTHLSQEEIGLLGAGAKKGDGPALWCLVILIQVEVAPPVLICFTIQNVNLNPNPMSNAHLSKAEFLARHKGKYDGEKLSAAERTKRYDQYLVSVRNAVSNRKPAHVMRASSAPRQSIQHAKQTGALSLRSKYESAVMKSPLLRAMLDPFDLAWNEGTVPRIPDGEFAETSTLRLRDERTVVTDANGGFCVFVRASPWSSIAVSNTAAAIVGTEINYVSPVEFNAFAAFASRDSTPTGYMPHWAENSWSVSAPNVNNTVSPDNVPADFQNAESLYDLAACWRPVCCGVKLKYIGAPIDASGAIVAARWPGAYKAPTTANQFLDMLDRSNVDTLSIHNGGPSFATVQNLPSGEILQAPGGVTAVWAPDSLSAQQRWRPTRPLPVNGTDGVGVLAGNLLSNSTTEVVLPPPVTGDPARMQALVDRLYSENISVQNSFSQNLLFTGTGADAAIAAQNRLNDLYTTDMVDGDNGIIIIGRGLPPHTEVFTCETVLGVEYIPDTRAALYGTQVAARAHEATPPKQAAQQALALTVAREAPSAVRGDGNAGDFVDKMVGGLNDAIDTGKKIFAGAERVYTTVGPIVESLLAML